MTKQDKRFLEINQGENWINIEHKTLIFECRYDLGWSVSAATEIKRKLYVTKQVHQNTLFYNKEGRQKGLDKINMCSFVVPSTPEYLHSLYCAKYLDSQVMLKNVWTSCMSQMLQDVFSSLPSSLLLNNLVFFLRHVLDEISKMPWICFHIDVLSTVLIPFIHIFALLLACRDWLIMSNACMLLVKQCFSH